VNHVNVEVKFVESFLNHFRIYMTTLVQKVFALSLCLTLLILTSCATIVKGSTDTIKITSIPPGAKVLNEGGEEIGVTPCDVQLTSKRAHKLSITSSGYTSRTVNIENNFSIGYTIGNLFSFSLLGILVDVASGSIYNLQPNEVNVTLSK
jgi:hypothetical protein